LFIEIITFDLISLLSLWSTSQKCWEVDQRLKRLGLEPSFQWKFSKILWSSSWVLGQVTCPKMAKNYFTYDVTHNKSATPNQKSFVECGPQHLLNLLSLWTAL